MSESGQNKISNFYPHVYLYLTLSQTSTGFLRVCSTSLENTVGKGEIACDSVFYLFDGLSSIFIKFEIVVCKLFQFGRV